MPLRLNVKPGERIFLGTSSFVINNEGTIGLVIDGKLPLLRETDYIWSKNATTPLRKFYCALQEGYLTERADDVALAETSRALIDSGLPAEKLAEISLAVLSGELFKALKAARKLLVEQESVDQWADVVGYSPEGFM